MNLTLQEQHIIKVLGLSVPKIDPKERAKIRLAFRNERVLYHRKCDNTGENIISVHHTDKSFPVWSYDAWFSDDWDAIDYGQPYDLTRPFMDQYKEMIKNVPRVALLHVRSIESQYLNLCADNKRCYMIFESSNNENCINGYWLQKCTDCVDVSFADSSELCYECNDIFNCYKVENSQSAYDCSESNFLYDCKGLQNCVGCVNLRQKSYCILNKQYSKEEYFLEKEKLALDTYEGREEFKKLFEEFRLSQYIRYAQITNSVNSVGNYIHNSKNCNSCFHAYDSEDCAYAEHVWENTKDCVDVSTAGRTANLIYNSINTGISSSNCISTNICWTCSFTEYSQYCFNSNNIFGCFGLRKKDYCILNYQYTKDEYLKIVEHIKNEMRETGEYGQFFPIELSDFSYNETVANEQFPMDENQSLNQGYTWSKVERGTFGKETISWGQIPQKTIDINFDVTKEIFVCIETGHNFKITEDEFLFYQKMNIPLPRIYPDFRHQQRMKNRGENNLYERQTEDGQTVLTSFPSTAPERIISEDKYKELFL